MIDRLVSEGIVTQEQKEKIQAFIIMHQHEDTEKLSRKRQQNEVIQSKESPISKQSAVIERNVHCVFLRVMGRFLMIRSKMSLKRFFHPFGYSQ